MVERTIQESRLGLAVLRHQGLAAWVERWSDVPATTTPTLPMETTKPCPLTNGTSTEIVHVLVAMALGHLLEVHA